MNNKLRMCLLLVLLAIALCFFYSACTTTQQLSEDANENNQSESIVTSQPEPDAQVQYIELKTWEQAIFIHGSLSDYNLKLYGEQDGFTELSLVDISTGAVVYEDRFDPEIYFVEEEQLKVEVIDMDFDGDKDIKIFLASNGLWNRYYIYYIWDSDTGKFINDPYGLSSLGLPSFDTEKQLVHSMVRGSAADHWFYTYQYVEGKLVTIEEVSDNCVWLHGLDDSGKEKIKALEPLYHADTTQFQHFMVEQLDSDSSKMVIVENKFILYDNSDMREEPLLAEYDFDSDLGLLLRELLGGIELPPHKLRTKMK